MVDPGRVKTLNNKPISSGPVIYWMYRDQRVEDNWALLYATQLAKENHTHVEVVVCLRSNLIDHSGTARMLNFLLGGLKEVSEKLNSLGIPFECLVGDPVSSLLSRPAAAIVCDQLPLNFFKQWLQKISDQDKCPVYQVDAHNIVPVWFASDHQEYGAYTLRPKIHRLLSEFLTPFPELHSQNISIKSQPNFDQVRSKIAVDESVVLPNIWQPGAEAAKSHLSKFISHLSAYAQHRNDPNQSVQSNLSPYLHFGQISAQTVASLALKHSHSDEFLEELVVRRELSDNYCYYNSHYASPSGYPAWAQKTLAAHASDSRPTTYTQNQLETSQTSDPIWNAAQKQMVDTGKMHGYMRMYWAKQIAIWTTNISQAHKIAIYLNDKYSLDGRDPNGYTGIAWSLGGVHDRPWFDRPIIGQIRAMTSSGLQKKFDTSQYISTVS